MRKLGRNVVVAFAIACMPVLAVALPAEAGGGGLACGTTITQNTTLTSNLGCPATAIRFGASNITLNLNGFTIFKTGEINCDCPGVHVLDQTAGRIINGQVSGFSAGIYLENGGGHTIQNVVARDNIGLLNGDTIFGEGIQLFQSNNNRILNNQLIHNGTFSGINLYDSANNLVQFNNVSQNNVIQQSAVHGGPTVMQDIGIWVISLSAAGMSSNNIVADNTVAASGLDGIQVSRFSGIMGVNQVLRNNVSGNGFGQVPGIRDGDGIAVFGINNLVQSNTVIRNAAHGIGVRAPGTQVGPGNRMIRNRVFGNNAGPNPAPNFDLFDGSPTCAPNVWSGNGGPGVTGFPACTLAAAASR